MSPHLRRLRAVLGSELLLLPSVTGIVFDGSDRILLVRQHEDGVWSTPGGCIEPDESPADAVVREVWEETGLYTDPTRLLGVYGGPEFVVTYPNGDRAAYIMSVFECEVRGGTLLSASDETSAAAFVGAAELPGYGYPPGYDGSCRACTIAIARRTLNPRGGHLRRSGREWSSRR
jgi:ADP-ribose pyrophosphatase YjhB (NUDIX family)